jgi:hypothetical protein
VTVAALPAVAEYQEDGVSTSFPVPFRFRSSTDLIVERLSDGVVQTLVLGVDYLVAGGTTDAGGTVTRLAATTGSVLRIRRDTARSQNMRYPTGGRFPAESHEEALDRQMLIAQEQDADAQDTKSRALLVPPGQTIGDIIIQPNSALVFGPDGQPLAKPIGSFPAGPTGAAENTYSDLAIFRASDVTRAKATLVGIAGVANGDFYWSQGDTTPEDGRNVIASTFAGANGRWLRGGSRAIVYVNSSPFATGEQNKLAWDVAIAAAEPGGRIVDPQGGGRYPIDTSKGPIRITKFCTIQQDGNWFASGHTYSNSFTPPQGMPFCVFATDGIPFVLKGSGQVEGDGTTDDVNRGDIRSHPTLYYLKQVTGAVLESATLTVKKPTKAGVSLDRCTGCTVALDWEGGVFPYSDTSFFGIVTEGGGGHDFSRNTVRRGADGGRIVNFIFTGGYYGACAGNRIHNVSFDVWEKVAYLYGENQDLENLSGLSVMTDAVRLNKASGSKINGLKLGDNSAGIVSIYDSSDITVSNAVATKLRQIAFYAARGDTSYTGGLKNIKIINPTATGNPTGATVTGAISGNILTVTAVTAGTLLEGHFLTGPGLADPTRIVGYGNVNADGTGTYYVKPSQAVGSIPIVTKVELLPAVRVLAQGADAEDITLINPDLSNFAVASGAGVVELTGQSPFAVRRAKVSGLKGMSTTQRAIVLSRVTDSVIDGVIFDGTGPSAVQEISCARNRHTGIFAPNVVAPGVDGLSATSTTDASQYGSTPLRGSITLTGPTTTIAGRFAPEAWATFAPDNDNASDWIKVEGPLIWAVVDGNISIRTKAGNTPPANTTFRYDVRN